MGVREFGSKIPIASLCIAMNTDSVFPAEPTLRCSIEHGIITLISKTRISLMRAN